MWLSRYPRCHYIICDNGSEFELNFEYLCVTYGIKRKPTTVKNPQANAILECLHQVSAQMLHTAELDMAETVTPNDVDVFLDSVAWAICSNYHTVFKTSQGVAIFGRNMLFNIPFIANWKKIGDYRQHQTDLKMALENSKWVDYDYKFGNKVLLIEEGILCKAESPYSKKPWTITTINTNGTSRIQCGTKSERLNIRRVTPFTEEWFSNRNSFKMFLTQISYSHQSYAYLMVILSLHLIWHSQIIMAISFTHWVLFPCMISNLIASFVGASVIGHG